MYIYIYICIHIISFKGKGSCGFMFTHMLPIFRQAADQSSKWPPGTAYLGPCPGRSLHKPPFQDGAALVRKMTCSEFEFKVRRLRLV